MFGFIFSFISVVTSEVKAAHVAQRVAEGFSRNQYTRNIAIEVESWIYLVFEACQECGIPVIDESHSDIHPACLVDLREFDKREKELEAWERANAEPRWFDQLEEEDPFEDNGYGHCLRCGHGLEESEWAIGDYCDGCRPVFLEDWESQQEAKAEAADEARRYPDESDDDHRYCPSCSQQLGDCHCN